MYDSIEKKKFKNILAFLAIMFNEDFHILMSKSPDYILEKWERYCESQRNDEYEWGLHPILKREFDAYLVKWELKEKPLTMEEGAEMAGFDSYDMLGDDPKDYQ